jgi:hypothetical protein
MTSEEDTSRAAMFFECNDTSEHEYVASLYGNRRTVVAAFLKDKCAQSPIKYSTHLDVFELIELKLGYPIPLKRIKAQLKMKAKA